MKPTSRLRQKNMYLDNFQLFGFSCLSGTGYQTTEIKIIF